MANDISRFVSTVRSSLDDDTFVKLTLGNYKGADEQLQKLLVRRITTRKGDRLELTFRYKTRDIAKNYSHEDALVTVEKLIGSQFLHANLFTTVNDTRLEIRKTGQSKVFESKPTFESKPALEHDREKTTRIDKSARYLHELGVTSEKGEILGKQRDKWVQINKFIEISAGLIESSRLKNAASISVVDMGSGKGYLTFSLYDYLSNTLGIETSVTGVEAREELVKFCNDAAMRCGFSKLRFVRDTIESFRMPAADITIALHACDTATDDAIFKGISARSELIITAPCCHKEIRRQIKAPKMLSSILKHGTLMESTAETITDGLRAMLLEREGYSARVFEFVGVEHTPKNNMIVATRRGQPQRPLAGSDIDQLKSMFGIETQRLEQLIEMSRAA
jgi:hypothetical protein